MLGDFATHGLITGFLGILTLKNCEVGDKIDFATQLANWNGLISCVWGTGLRNVLPRKGTRTRIRSQQWQRRKVKKCITPKGDENIRFSVCLLLCLVKKCITPKGDENLDMSAWDNSYIVKK